MLTTRVLLAAITLHAFSATVHAFTSSLLSSQLARPLEGRPSFLSPLCQGRARIPHLSRNASPVTLLRATAAPSGVREVLVVGGGPGGLAAALELDRVLNQSNSVFVHGGRQSPLSFLKGGFRPSYGWFSCFVSVGFALKPCLC